MFETKLGAADSYPRRPLAAITGPGAAALVLWALALTLIQPRSVNAGTASNAESPLGINVAQVRYWTPEQPLLNVFNTADAWITHAGATWDTNEEKYLNLDANGWPVTLTAVNEPGAQQFTSVGILMLRSLPSTPYGVYPAGQYIVLYDGQGTMTYGADAALVSRAPGKDTINVATPTTGGGIELRISATDPNHNGNYIRNIRVVKAENLAAMNAGQMFNPAFLGLMRNFRAVRFMDWLGTNGNTLASWSHRPTLSSAFWGTANGVPIEAAVALANAISADAWLNTPIMADDGYIRQMAALVHDELGSTQKVYVELSNEVWNAGFPQYEYAASQGRAMFPGGLGSPFDYNRNWYGMRVGQMCDIWKSVWAGDSRRVVCLLAAQAANPYTATESLTCPFWSAGKPCSKHNISAVAIGPYFGGSLPAAWTAQPDGGLTNLFASLYSQNDPSIPAGGWLAQVSGWERAYVAMLAAYDLPLYCYECGQSFVDPSSAALTKLYDAANLDPRMAAAYAAYLRQWKADGGQMIMMYDDISVLSAVGDWGALQSIMQAASPLGSAPHKWQAIQKFISTTQCWWPGCGEPVGGAAPVPSKKTKVQ
jgi:hypothetical protein